MPSSVIGALRVQLGLDAATFVSGATAAERRAELLGKRIADGIRKPIFAASDGVKAAVAGLVTGATVATLTAASKRAFDFADSIVDLSDRTGASTKTIQEFRYAAQLSGSSVEVADAATEKFARTLGLAQQGSDAQVKLFRSLGVTSTDYDTALRQTIDGISKLPSVQERAAVGFQIFGKSSATLTGLLGQGLSAYDELADAAARLGIVLGDDVLRNAGKVNDQLDTLKMIMDAQFASAIINNADNIAKLIQVAADGFSGLTRLAANEADDIRGAFAGLGDVFDPLLNGAKASFGGIRAEARLVQNAIGLVLQGVDNVRNIRVAVANAQTRADNLLNPFSDKKALQPYYDAAGKFRRGAARQNQQAEQAGRQALGRSWNPGLYGGRGMAKPAGALPTQGNNEAKAAASKATAAAKREAAERKRAADKALHDERRYEQELGRSRDEALAAQGELTVEAVDRAQIERERLANDDAARAEAIRTDKDLSDAQKAKLLALNATTTSLKAEAIERQLAETQAKEELDRSQARSDNEQDILNAQLGLARTAKERRAIEAQILASNFDMLKAVQQAVIDSQNSTETEKQLARERIATLDRLKGYAQAKNNKENAGPFAQYLDSLPRTADQINEAFESVQANGISGLIDGISQAKLSFKSLADVVDNVANEMIASLLRIGLQRGIAALFGKLLGTPATGSIGASSSLAIGATGADGLINFGGFGGPKAKGGHVVGGKSYFVGEQGPEFFTAPHSGNIVANDDLPMGGARTTIHQNITIPAGVDLMTRTEGYRLAGAVKDATMSAIDDRNRRRG